MKYIFFTFDGSGLPIADHLLHEGCEVTIGQVQDENYTITRRQRKTHEEESSNDMKRRLNVYKNMLEKLPADVLVKRMKKIKNPEEYFVFFESNNLFYYADQIRDLGFEGNFPTEKDLIFEVDRDEAKEFVKKHYPEIEIIGKKEFRSVNSARKFLKESNQIWVIKGRGGGETFVPHVNDPELARWQVIETLEAFQNEYEETGFVLEEKIPSVIEITPEKMYYNGVPLALTVNFENKTVGSGNLSLQTGCAADLVFPIGFNSRIHDIAFPKVIDKMAKKHQGLFIWDASLLINSETGRIYFGEFCSNRVGYNSFFTELSQLPSVNHFFKSAVAQKNPFKIGTVGASLSFFNLSRDPLERHLLSGPSVNYPDTIKNNIWLLDVYKKRKNDRIRIVGYDWQLGATTGAGNSIDQAVNNLYKNVEQFSLGSVYYRPKSDYLSMDYPTSILNRLRYCVGKKLFEIPFNGIY